MLRTGAVLGVGRVVGSGVALVEREGLGVPIARPILKTMIEGYEIFPGEHCGSASMRGLLKHYCGLALPEPAVFGLSAGLECAYFESPALDPGGAVLRYYAQGEIAVSDFVPERAEWLQA